MHVRSFGIASFALLTTCPIGLAATATFSVVPKNAPTATSVTVDPGSAVVYEIRLIVTPEDTANPDTDGLAGFAADLLTNTGVTQAAASAFGPEVQTNLTAFPSLGTPTEDDIEGISANQFTLGGSEVAGIALNTTIVLATGAVTMPSTEGTFTISLGTATSANVLNPGDQTGAFKPTIELGNGFTVITSAGGSGGDGTDNATQLQQLISAFLVIFSPLVFIVTIVAIIFLLMQ